MKTSKPFVFKQFTVNQNKCALKVNTDAVLLGSLAESENPSSILDIGAGTGVISLMLAQRFPNAFIHSVEIENNAFLQAKENFSDSPWAGRLKIFYMPFQQLGEVTDNKYDLIVSNPPYYTDHLKTLNTERNIALHSEYLTFDELSGGVKNKLSEKGEFFVILPERQMKQLEKCFIKIGMHSRVKLYILDKPGAQTLRVIQSFGFMAYENPFKKELIIKNITGTYSSEYATLLKDFLLIF